MYSATNLHAGVQHNRNPSLHMSKRPIPVLVLEEYLLGFIAGHNLYRQVSASARS